MEPKVVIIVLNYCRWEDTVQCVQSLKQCHYPNFEIIVVDNDSPDDSVLQMRKRLHSVDILSSGSNRGYAGGINFSIRIAKKKEPEYVLVINNDTAVQPDFLDYLVAALEENKKAAAACGTIYCYHDKMRIWYAGGRFIPWRGLAVHDHRSAILAPSKLNGIRRVSFITGCLILLRMSCLEDIGMEDERFFMYLDDIEFSARICSKGYDLLYVPKSVIFHKVAGEKESAFKLYYSARNRLLVINTSVSGYTRVVAHIYFLSVISAKLVYWFFFNKKFFHAAFDGLHDYFSNNFYMGRGVGKFLE
ncbi:MAG: glycosyltransferase family 2 protein [Bacteroidota bacterium]